MGSTPNLPKTEPRPCCEGKSMAPQGKHFSEGPMPSASKLSRPNEVSQLDFELDFFTGILERSPDYVDVLRILASLLTLKGRVPDSLRANKRLVRLRPADPLAHYNLACTYALLNRREHSIKALRRAVELGYRDFRYMREDHDLESIRHDLRFRQLITEYENL